MNSSKALGTRPKGNGAQATGTVVTLSSRVYSIFDRGERVDAQRRIGLATKFADQQPSRRVSHVSAALRDNISAETSVVRPIIPRRGRVRRDFLLSSGKLEASVCGGGGGGGGGEGGRDPASRVRDERVTLVLRLARFLLHYTSPSDGGTARGSRGYTAFRSEAAISVARPGREAVLLARLSGRSLARATVVCRMRP